MKLSRSETIAKNKADKRIEKTYYRCCAGVQINVLDIPKVFARGHELIKGGADDATLADGIVTFVQTLQSAPK